MRTADSMHRKIISKDEEIAIRRSFVKQSFLDVADYDYIGARTLFRNECWDQFLYLAHQCIEKYLKAILLFNDIKHPRGGHDLEELLAKFQKIKTVKPEKETGDFIKELNSTQFVRYLSAPIFAKKDYLIKLDKAVWDLRLFCRPRDYQYKINGEQIKNRLLDYSIAGGKIIFFGCLEKVLENKKGKFTKPRDNLVWKNFSFGRKKHSIKFALGWWSKNPIFFLGDNKWKKKVFNMLSKYVSFEKEVRDYFKNLK